jgi:hypothetical protein
MRSIAIVSTERVSKSARMIGAESGETRLMTGLFAPSVIGGSVLKGGGVGRRP